MALRFLSPIHKANRQVGLHLQGPMAELGLSNAEAHLLGFLSEYAPASVGHLHRVFGHKRSTLTSMLDRLEGRGLLRRDVHPDDRRSFLVSLTTEGCALARRAILPVQALEQALDARVDPADHAAFLRVLAAVEAATAVHLSAKESPCSSPPSAGSSGSPTPSSAPTPKGSPRPRA